MITWHTLFPDAQKLADRSRGIAGQVQEQLTGKVGVADAWFQPDSRRLLVRTIPGWTSPEVSVAADVEHRVLKTAEDWAYPGTSDEAWCGVFLRPKKALLLELPNEKVAADKNQTLANIASILGWTPDVIDIPMWATPASAALATGLVGAGLGHGVGWLGKKFKPLGKDWDYDYLQRLLTIGGGALGAAPGIGLGAAAYARHGMYPTDRRIFNDPDPPKLAYYNPGNIDVPKLDYTLWNDPVVSSQLSLPQKAMTSGLVQGAAQLSGQPTARFVSPIDMARMTGGMGSGYISGAILGKILGVLTGMPQGVQDQMKERGQWAGALVNALPMAFGGR